MSQVHEDSIATFDRHMRVEHLRRRLSEAGHRITPQRISILDALVTLSHPTAEEIFANVVVISPTTSLATVYKTLDTLRQIGEVQELEVGAGRRHYDGLNPHSHPHAVCRSCGKIEDVRLEKLPSLTEDAEAVSGYRLDNQRVEFYGLCPICQATAK